MVINMLLDVFCHFSTYRQPFYLFVSDSLINQETTDQITEKFNFDEMIHTRL